MSKICGGYVANLRFVVEIHFNSCAVTHVIPRTGFCVICKPGLFCFLRSLIRLSTLS